MEVRENYKESEIGKIPSDWDIKKLGEIGAFSKGLGIRKDESKSGQIPCIRYGELYTNHSEFVKRFYSFISKEVARTSKRLKVGDILFAGSGETKEEIGKCSAFITEVEAYAGGDIVILTPDNVDSKLLGYLLNAPFAVKQKSSKGQGDAIVHISVNNLKDIIIPLPPTKAEQTAIATALSDTDALISSLENLIAKKRNIKQGAMQRLLKPKEGWEVKRLGEISNSISSGKSLTNSKIGKFPIYGSTGVIGWSNSHDYEGNKILVARVGANAGYVNKVDGRYCVSDNTLMISLKKDIDLNFVFFKLINYQLNTFVFGSGQPLITGGQIKVLEFPIPSFEEQKKIASVLLDMDAEIISLETKLRKHQKVKLGMMQTLLTGRIRLNKMSEL